MKNMIKGFIIQFLRLVVLLILTNSSELFSQQVQDILKKPDATTTEIPQVEALTLSEIIPEASVLSDKLTILENSIKGLIDVSSINKKYKKVADDLKFIESNFNVLIKEEQVNTEELDILKGDLDQLGQIFYETDKALINAIQTLEKSRTEWLNYQQKWNKYESYFLTQEVPDEAKLALKNAKETIKKGLGIVIDKLNVLLKLQQNGYDNQSVINDLNNQILVLKQKKLVSAFEDGSIPMYSSKFLLQFNDKLWLKVKRGFSKVILPNESFFQNYGWLYVLQIITTLFIIYLIRKNETFLNSKKEFEFITNRSVSAGLFFGVIMILMFHIDTKSPSIWRLFLFIVGGLAFCRLISNRNSEPWKKQFNYVLVAVIIISGFFQVFNIPVPLFRIFVLMVSLIGIYKLYEWNKKNKLTTKSKKYTMFFNLLSLYLWIIVISEIIGKEVLALYMYEALLKTIIIAVFAYVFIKMIQVGIEAGLKSLSNDNSKASSDADELIHKTVIRVTTIIGVLVIMLGVLPRILVYWNLYKEYGEAYANLMSIGFNIGKTKISLGVLIASLSIFYGSYILSTIIEMILMNNRYDKKLDKGARLSIAQLIRYFLVFFGFLIAIAAIGFDLTNFAIVLSALSVGIGFGLQGLVNNFVSGLILLFERPIREGDTIEVEGVWSDVKKIGLRSTTVQTFDQSDIIIPNADLVYNKVTNWTLSNKRKRIKILVGVAYGSNVALVIETLKEVGNSNEDLVKSYKPVVLFVNFADSTLNFELRVWAKDANISMQIESDLRQEIDKRFRENNIEIAFPQRDLHIKTIEKEIILKPTKDKN